MKQSKLFVMACDSCDTQYRSHKAIRKCQECGDKLRHTHWNELTWLGKDEQARELMAAMLGNFNTVKKENGWPGYITFYYLDTKYHLVPKDFGMKVSLDGTARDILGKHLYSRILGKVQS